jgi:hypothetical protein
MNTINYPVYHRNKESIICPHCNHEEMKACDLEDSHTYYWFDCKECKGRFYAKAFDEQNTVSIKEEDFHRRKTSALIKHITQKMCELSIEDLLEIEKTINTYLK